MKTLTQPAFEIKKEEQKDGYGRFVIEPLEQGYGHTLGSSLRRVMLTSLPGTAITQVKVQGLKHQFGTLKGVKEDGVDLLLNLKGIRLAYRGEKPVKLTLSSSGKGGVLAGQIKAPADVRVVNPDWHIATLADSKSKLDIEITAESGVGYSPAEERKTGTVGLIPLDADFSPVKQVNYKVEETRVGRLTNYDKLAVEVWTDGSMEPDEAVKQAAQILQSYLGQVVSPAKPAKSKGKEEKKTDTYKHLSVEELGLPTRISNALVKTGYETVADILEAKEDLSKVRNLGAKSVKVINAALRERGIEPREE